MHAVRQRRALVLWTGSECEKFDRHDCSRPEPLCVYRRRVGSRPALWTRGLYEDPRSELWEHRRLGGGRAHEARSLNVGGRRETFAEALCWAGPILFVQKHRCDAPGLGGWAAMAHKAGWAGLWAPARVGPMWDGRAAWRSLAGSRFFCWAPAGETVGWLGAFAGPAPRTSTLSWSTDRRRALRPGGWARLLSTSRSWEGFPGL